VDGKDCGDFAPEGKADDVVAALKTALIDGRPKKQRTFLKQPALGILGDC